MRYKRTLLISRVCHFLWAIESSSGSNPERTLAPTLPKIAGIPGDLSNAEDCGSVGARLWRTADNRWWATCRCFLSKKTKKSEMLSWK
jgi:hypothetical protein